MFWIWILGLLAAHLLVFGFVLTVVQEWRLIWFLPISVAEYALLVRLLHWLGYDEPIASKRRRGRIASRLVKR
jgi:hypothetical protein